MQVDLDNFLLRGRGRRVYGIDQTSIFGDSRESDK